MGLAHCVLIARDFLGGDDFVMYCGDNLLEQDLRAFVDEFEKARRTASPRPTAQILLKEVPDPQRFGVAELDDAGHVVRLIEKPADPPSNLAFVGVYLFDATIHDAVRAIEPSARGELEITDAIQWLIDQGRRVRTELLTGWWIDTGKLTPLLEANRLLLEKIEPACERQASTTPRRSTGGSWWRRAPRSSARRSAARSPSARARKVVDSFVGPFSAIGADCEIISSEVEHSVVMDRSRIIEIARLEDSLIGREAVVSRSHVKPRALRLMVGDHCQVDVE